MNKINNQRRKNTEEKIITAFLKLLSQKPVSKITVREICENANITRTSFYGHYEDIYSLMRQVEHDVTIKMLSFYYFPSDIIDINQRAAYIHTFKYINENRSFFQYFFENAEFESSFILECIAEQIGEILFKQNRFYIIFFMGGLNALIKYWLSTGCQETPEEMAEILIATIS